MKKLKILVLLFFVFGLFTAFTGAVSAKEINPVDIKQKLQVNSETKGKKFTVGIMGNYYKICLNNNIASVYEDVKVLKCSNTEVVSSLGEKGIQRTKNILDSNVAGFSVNLPRGYGYTLLYALGITDNSKTNESYRETTDLSVALYSSKSDTICLTEVVDSSTYYSDIDRSKLKATLFLVGDIIKVDLTVKQYQSLWWGDQPLYTEEVTAYVICNLHDYVEYTE